MTYLDPIIRIHPGAAVALFAAGFVAGILGLWLLPLLVATFYAAVYVAAHRVYAQVARKGGAA